MRKGGIGLLKILLTEPWRRSLEEVLVKCIESVELAGGLCYGLPTSLSFSQDACACIQIREAELCLCGWTYFHAQLHGSSNF